ncbi:MAG: AAA family ATPase [Rectinema sp.]
MKAQMDCVAITDHNSGEWVDLLKRAYGEMKEKAGSEGLSGFRELVLFPGVEISVHGGIHLLAIFDPSATTSDIDTLLGEVEYRGNKGECDGETVKSISEVIQKVWAAGGIPIPAHADKDKGLFQVQPGSHACTLDAGAIRQVLENGALTAMEWCDQAKPLPDIAVKDAADLTRVVGSDCHSFDTTAPAKPRYTWVKMESADLEGLRLALIDGNGVSVKRDDDSEPFDPFRQPPHLVSEISVTNARYMGNGSAEHFFFSPYCNALIGGRGTGKSTVVHFLRLALQRGNELARMGSVQDVFEKFIQIPRSRNDSGALRENTEITVDWLHDEVPQRIVYRVKDKKQFEIEVLEQDRQGHWQPSRSQSVNAERFPLRIFSQGQIAEMAENGQALLEIIDEAAGMVPYRRAFEDAKRTFFAQRARLREIEGKLEQLSEVERKLEETGRKLNTLSDAHSADIYRAYQRAQRQKREVAQTLTQLNDFAEKIEGLSEELLLDDWPEGVFDQTKDADILKWRGEADTLDSQMAESIRQASGLMREHISALQNSEEYRAWNTRMGDVEKNYTDVNRKLSEAGISDPQEFDQWMAQRQSLELEQKELQRLSKDRESLIVDIESQARRVLDARRVITEARKKFLQDTIQQNKFVRIEMVPFGDNKTNIERSFRELIQVPDDRFSEDILKMEGQASRGLAAEIASASDDGRLAVIEKVKNKILNKEEIGGTLKNYLDRMFGTPGFSDNVACWYPEDDLKIEYSRDGRGSDWVPISQGSKGQRSAALLAFLLAFGEEPLVLDQPEDDLDNHLIYDLIVAQIRENKLRRQLIVVTHNANIVVNGDAEMIYAMDFKNGQCVVAEDGALQQKVVRLEVCRIMEGGREALARRWARLGKEIPHAGNAE